MEPDRTHRRLTVSWFELFYDLAIVATLVALNESFLSNPDPMNALLPIP